MKVGTTPSHETDVIALVKTRLERDPTPAATGICHYLANLVSATALRRQAGRSKVISNARIMNVARLKLHSVCGRIAAGFRIDASFRVIQRMHIMLARCRNSFAWWIVLLLPQLGWADQTASERLAVDTSQMNVLMIDIEDCRADVWGCYGNSICKTPNIDRLATSGVLFERAYCQYVCCNPSRSSFLTGLRPHTTRVLSNGDNSREKLPPGTLSLPQLMKRHGYYTANVGKLFHSSGSLNAIDMSAYDRIEFQDRPAGWQGPDPILPPAAARSSRVDPPAPKQGEPGYDAWRRSRSDRYGASGLTDDEENDGKYARTAVALLREFSRQGQRNFFLSLGSSRPHTPLICPQKYIDIYDPAEIPAPHAPRHLDQGVPDLAVRFGRPADIWMSRTPTPAEVQATIAAYYACVTFLDTQLGLLLDALQAEGLADNTIVIFFSDHGFHLGEHGHWSKYTLFEQSTRVPMIVRIPGNRANGSRCDEIVELVDLLPTLGELLQMEVPENLEGTSFVPLLADPTRPGKQAAFTVFGNQGQYNSIRTKQHRYTEWQHEGEVIKELYDLESDPWETINLAGEVAHADTRAKLAKMLHGS